ncbi:hypothetical protein OAI84_00725 [bacterium]|nr:hypothetical protein [bacterium]
MDINDYVFSIAWKLNNESWKTYYRNFSTTFGKYYKNQSRILIGQYLSNLYFDEDIDLNNSNIVFMVYATPKTTQYKEIKSIFQTENFKMLFFYDTFRLTSEFWKSIKSDLNYSNYCFIRLNNSNKNVLILRAYKGKSTHIRNEKYFGVTLPNFRIKLNLIFPPKVN